MALYLPWSRRAASSATTESVVPAASRPTRDWASLAPLQSTLRDHSPALLDPSGFRAGLSTMWSTPPALERLGHLVTPDAPVGLLPGLAVPVQAYDAPQLRFAPAHEDVPAAPARSRSWLPASLSRKAPVAETPRPARATSPQPMSEAAPNVVPPVVVPERASIATPPETSPATLPAVLPTSTPTALSDALATDTSTASPVIDSAPPSGQITDTTSAAVDGSVEVRPTLGTPAASAAGEPLPRPRVRHDADSTSTATTTVEPGAPGFAEHAVAGQTLPDTPAQVAGIAPATSLPAGEMKADLL